MPLAGAAQHGILLPLLLADGKPDPAFPEWEEPVSVLDLSSSPPPASAFTLSSSPLPDVAARTVSSPAWHPGDDPAGGKHDDWVHHLPPLDMAATWEATHAGSMMPDHAAAQPQADNTYLHWFMNDASSMDDHPGLHLDHRMSMDDTKPPPPPPFGPAVHPALPAFDDRRHHQAKPPKPEPAATDTTAVDDLAEAAKLAESGDIFSAREVLARLNHQPLEAATPPLLRAAFYFTEALRAALSATATPTSATPAEVDVLLKLGAHKAFSDASPVLPFAHLTCVQAVLDALGGAACIHVLDFDIGVGEQWASLMLELAQRRRSGAPAAALKVTALVSSMSAESSSSASTALELQLVHESLSSFAASTGVPFQFAAFRLDAAMADPAELHAIAGGGDAVAVHLPVGAVHAAAVPSVLGLVRQLGAKLVVTVDDRGGGERGDQLPFAAHLFQAFQACAFLLDSLDAVGTSAAVAAKIERFVIQPRVASFVARSWHGTAAAGEITTPPWWAMLASAGFVPVASSGFAEAQADSLLKKLPVRGFRVEKRAGSLALHWQRGKLVSVSAWRC